MVLLQKYSNFYLLKASPTDLGCFYDTAGNRRWLSTCFSRHWKTCEKEATEGGWQETADRQLVNWHIPSSGWHALVPKVSLSATWIPGSPWTSLKVWMTFCPHMTGPQHHPTFCSWAPPRRDRTYRTTLCEPLEFTISLSHHIADAPQAIPLKHFSIKWMEGFLAIIIVENYAWLIKQQLKNAGFLTQYLELKKAPNTPKHIPPLQSWDTAENGSPHVCLPSLLQLG